MLDAFAELKRRRPAALLVVAGDGEVNYVNSIKYRAERLGIAADVVWTGFLDGTEKFAAFSIARMFVLPSHSENFGIAVVEALAAGVPTIISREVGIARDIEAARAGIVVEREPTLLAQAMERLLVDAGLSGQLSANARKLAVERYSLEAMESQLVPTLPGNPTGGKKQMKSSITPLVLTFNEAPNIGRTLDRLAWAKEIVVLDSFSTDDTEAICRKIPSVRFIQRKFDDHTKPMEFWG